jgi:hypothetical protein
MSIPYAVFVSGSLKSFETILDSVEVLSNDTRLWFAVFADFHVEDREAKVLALVQRTIRCDLPFESLHLRSYDDFDASGSSPARDRYETYQLATRTDSQDDASVALALSLTDDSGFDSQEDAIGHWNKTKSQSMKDYELALSMQNEN